MVIQELMQKGAPNCSKLEKVADLLLRFPRGLWLGREVTLIKSNGGIYAAKSNESDSCVNFFKENKDVLLKQFPDWALITGICFVVLSILATPFLAAGLACKKIAFYNNPKAAAYNTLANKLGEKDHLLQIEDDYSEQWSKVDSNLEENRKKLKIYENNVSIFNTDIQNIKPKISEQETEESAWKKAMNDLAPKIATASGDSDHALAEFLQLQSS